MNVPAVARIFHELMIQLGYTHGYYAAGGDWGNMIVTRMAVLQPVHLKGIWLNALFVRVHTLQ